MMIVRDVRYNLGYGALNVSFDIRVGMRHQYDACVINV